MASKIMQKPALSYGSLSKASPAGECRAVNAFDQLGSSSKGQSLGQGVEARQRCARSGPMAEQLLAARKENYGPNTSVSYDQPLHIVRGEGCYLYDAEGRRYLDCINNVAHVGHCHPKVLEAITSQLSQLNTNSRYLHSGLTEYTQLLLSTMNKPLEVLYMVNSGSEANDLALRMAHACRPGATHVAVMAGAYHGHTASLIPLSPYKFWGHGGEGKAPHVHVIPCPDPYRGENMDGQAAARAVIAAAHNAGGKLCAFFCESVLSCGGQVVLPPGYLQAVYKEMQDAGAIVIADEVQSGFGRVGTHFWGYQTQGVVPDIVTMGKCVVAALVTNKKVCNGFVTGMEYFNTYGGSTGATAAAMATLQVTLEDSLQQHAQEVGQYLREQLECLRPQYPFLGDVRGIGLMVGVEVVLDPGTHQTHAPRLARWLKERMKARQVLLSTDGPYDNVIKMKPPLVFGTQEVDTLVQTLRWVTVFLSTTHLPLWEVLSKDLGPLEWANILEEETLHRESTTQPRMELYRSNEATLFSGLAGSRLLMLEARGSCTTNRSKM
eukprot:gene11143-18762_t